MTGQDSGTNLLFGVIALQLDLIDPRRFAEACSAWAVTKETSLADLILDRGWITDEDRAEIERVLHRKLDRHGGDALRSLDAAVDHSIGTLVSAAVLGVDSELGFATGPTRTVTADPPDPADAAPTIDAPRGMRERFRLVRMYAKGGLGQVWLARDPLLGREVALKELRPERADDPTSRARLLREARITGRLEHPGIVTVHELSRRTGDGRSFYAMQLVRGRTLHEAVREYHRRHGDGPGGTLELHDLLDDFVAVCNAVAYAHSRGVIHRDLKGQNIVLGDYGEVVVLDWGLAKVVGEAGSDDPESPAANHLDEAGKELTLEGQRMGTPGFMAPEQAEGRHDLVGFASDVYGLGAILYEILTGRPPFGDSGVTEAMRRVREEDPVAPRQVFAGIPCALEAVCLKALSRRPEDRYATASDLAQDVKRWLADEPVSAYPEPAAERLGRWTRRHRPVVGGVAALLAIVVAGLLFVVLERGREQAKTRAALASEAWHRRRAEANFDVARDAVDNLYGKVLANPLLSEPGMGPLRGALIQTTQEFYAKLVGLVPEDPDLRENLAESYLTLSRVTLRAGEVDRAIDQIHRASKIYEGLEDDYPKQDRYRAGSAHCLLELAECDRDASRPDDAAAAYDRAVTIYARLVAETKSPVYSQMLATAYHCLGSVYRSVGRWDRAASAHGESLSILRKLADEAPPGIDRERTLDRLAACLIGLANIAEAKREWSRADSLYRQGYDAWIGLQAAHPRESYRSKIASMRGGWSRVLAASGRPVEAREMRERALQEWAALAKEHPETVQYRDCVANEHVRVGEYFEYEGRPADAASHYEAARAVWEELAPRHPARPDLTYGLARALFHQARLRDAADRRTEAEKLYRRAKALWERLPGRLHEDYVREYRADLDKALDRM